MKICIIAPKFNGTEKTIELAIKNYGCECFGLYYDEGKFRKNKWLIPLISILRLLGFVSKNDRRYYWDWWYKLTFNSKKFDRLLESYNEICKNEKPEVILVIKGLGVNASFLKKIKNDVKCVTLILYQWDSFERLPSVEKVLNDYDKIFSFEESNANITYLPLFSRFAGADNVNSKKLKIDYVFVGSFTVQRLITLLYFYLFKRGYRYNCKIILVHGLKFFGNFGWFRSSKVSLKQYEDLVLHSKCIIEIVHKGQTGGTQRLFDALAQGKKILTNNFKDYEKYRKFGVFFINGENLDEVLSEKQNCSEEEISKVVMSSSAWVAKIFK